MNSLDSFYHPLVSVLVVNYNAGQYLAHCLRCLAGQTMRDFEVLVADNASTDGSISSDILPDDRFRLYNFKTNFGFAWANNYLAQEARSKWLALVNPDTFPQPDWLEEMVHSAFQHPETVMFGSTLLCSEEPQLIDGCGDAYGFCGLAWRGNHHKPKELLPPLGETFGPCAAAALIRTDCFLNAGGFDPDFFCYFEDVDLAFRLRLAGHRCLQSPNVKAFHVGEACSDDGSEFSLYHGHRNGLWSHIKNMPAPLIALTLPLHILALIALWAYKSVQAIAMEGISPGPRWLMSWAVGKALGHGLLASGKAWHKRPGVQATRRISQLRLLRAITWSPFKMLRRRHDVRPLDEYAARGKKEAPLLP